MMMTSKYVDLAQQNCFTYKQEVENGSLSYMEPQTSLTETSLSRLRDFTSAILFVTQRLEPSHLSCGGTLVLGCVPTKLLKFLVVVLFDPRTSVL